MNVLEYALGVGFPDTHFYGNDAGVAFGSGYTGSVSVGVAQHEVLGYAQANGYPNASLFGDPVEGVAFNV